MSGRTVKPRERTREALPAPTFVNLAKTAGQIVLFWGFFLFVVSAAILWLEGETGLDGFTFASHGWRVGGAFLFVSMSAVGLWCALIFATLGRGTPFPLDTATRLVLVGPYRVVRNPMAMSGIGQGIAVGMYLGSPFVIAYALAGAVLWNCTARGWEEADLSARFGEPYDRYRDTIPCWIPVLRPYPKEIDCRAPA